MLKKFLYIMWACVFVVILFLGIKNGSFLSFIEAMENRTFDIRQNLIANSGHRKHNDNIVIIAIDDASYEYILDNYGEWPLRRDMYAKMVDFLEKQNPKSIAFDLMFVKSMKSNDFADKELIKIFQKYDNVYTAMNLDDQPEDLRIPPSLPEKLSVKIQDIKDTTEILEYSNCRNILPEIIDATSNIGMINVSRSDDGVLREMPLFLKYQGKYYPQLALLVAQNSLEKPIDYLALSNNGNSDSVIINWYGGAGTFENIPMYKLLKAAVGKENFDYDFKDKIIYFGATAASLFDIKTVPSDRVYPGVEVQATYVNNLLDNSFIVKCPLWLNILAGILLAVISALCVFTISSMLLALGASVTVYVIYVVFSYLLMYSANVWLSIVSPLAFALLAFIGAVIIKYLIKSRDFDTQYKLATTDGLTELYNHRYFQEQMQNQVSHCNRYGVPMSLIIIDIDFFKKFNDSFGHQSGDAVLRQVAFVLKKNVRSADIVCRYGGEEMSIILPNTKYEEAVKIAEKLCNMVAAKTYKLSNGRESNVTISLGVASFGDDGTTPAQIIENADKRLYNAKNNGRNRVN